MLSFDIRKQSGSARLSQLCFTADHQKDLVPLSCPALLPYTRTGYLPHLTLAFTQSQQLSFGTHLLSLEHFLENKYDKHTPKQTLSISFRQFLNHNAKEVLFCDARDLTLLSGRHTFREKVTLHSPNQQQSHLTPETFAEAIARWKPDVCFSLSDYGAQPLKTPCLPKEPTAKKQKSVSKAVYFLQQTINHWKRLNLDKQVSLLGVLPQLQSDHVALTQEIVDLFDSDLQGYVVPCMQLNWAESLQALPTHKPRVAVGLISLSQMVAAIEQGIDLMDNAWLSTWTKEGKGLLCDFKTGQQDCILVSDAVYKHDFTPLSPQCKCFTCQKKYSKAYMHHLWVRNEMLVLTLLQIHNQHQLSEFMCQIRETLSEGTFSSFVGSFK